MPPRQSWDGQTLIISQTTANSFRSCPELFRRIWITGEVVDWPGDDALRGIIAHSGVSEFLSGADRLDPEDGASVVTFAMMRALNEEKERGGNPFVTDDTLAGAIEAFIRWRNSGAYEHYATPMCESEVPFRIEGDGYVVQGEIDLVCPDTFTVVDWKFPGKLDSWKRNDWEKKRYDVQPTFYLWAVSQMIGCEIEDLKFIYAVIAPEGVLELPIYRTKSDVRNLEREIQAMLRMVRTGTDGPWPLRPDTWMCGKWCPVFMAGECMGETPPSWTYGPNTAADFHQLHQQTKQKEN